ncbi:unnamed protein product [Didymodactylos carnosus]|uniref:Uncharacterized protein n=1 Tax=Didymodactylos carnosus TaxID=1234261 RepID=A0A814MF44_9BILA|nr:unnamed protein product [Didymodactylos carnosus]CAF3844590.1 unnamed protein product [Didymodactylos carnosus]
MPKKITEHCKQYCANRPIDLKLFKDFDTTCCKERAIDWYTRNCFLNPLINVTLRSNSIDMIIDFCPIIADIHDQLNEMQSKFFCDFYHPLHIFQYMTKTEFDSLASHIGGYISNNTFFLTQRSSSMAVLFVDEGSSENGLLKSVLFEIEIGNKSSKPWADISDKSFYRDNEILLTVGNIFRIESIEDFNNVTLIYLTLYCDGKSDIIKRMNDHFDIAMLQLIEIFPKISRKTDRINERMFEKCKFYYAHDPIKLAKIKEFEKTYKFDAVIRWYTKDTFLYRLVNLALRNENIDMILDLRYFIIDLCDELTKMNIDYIRNIKKLRLTVYKG